MPKAALLGITRAPKSEDPIVAAMRHIRKRQRESYKASDALAENENEATGQEFDRAWDSRERACWRMAMTEPTTVAGCSAMLSFITSELFEYGEHEWHERAWLTVTAALAKITRQPQRAA